MSVQPTSVAAYAALNLNRCDGEVYKVIKQIGPCTIAEIAAALGWQKSTVSGRRLSLIERGLVSVQPNRPCRVTGRNVQTVE